MKTQKQVWITAFLGFICCLAQQARAAETAAQAAPGTIVGLVTNSAKQPISHATITAVKAGGGSIRATISGSDGVYSFADLAPGTWSVTAEVEGAPAAPARTVEVVASKASRFDLVMNAPGLATQPPVAAVAPSAPAAPTASAPPHELTFREKLTQFVPKALMSPPATEGVDNETPFAFGDFTWLNGSPRNKAPVFDTAFFTPDIRLDAHYMQDFNGPKDHTIVGSTEEFRSGEFQVEQISIGGDFHYDNVRARILLMDGLFATTTPRNDASSAVGQWDLGNAYRYVSEANAGYHFDVNHGLNIDAGIFVSYIGLFSYYNFDNWTYQPSFVSSNTPWFFNGIRIQWFPTNKLKIEPWIINGWQSYARFNGHLGYGGQILWQPNENLKLVFNNYGVGNDNLGLPHTTRYHTDDSIEYKYFNNPGGFFTKAAFSFTADAGCQSGGGLHCTGGANGSSFLGAMFYNRIWFDNDLFAVTVGGGAMNNPGRYLTLLPPINGATAATGTPYFTENPGQPAFQWDSTINLQYMPKQWITWWSELGFRHSSIPYFAGQGGVTPPGGNNGSPASFTCNSGATAGTADPTAAASACSNQGGIWQPDLRTRQLIWAAGVLVKF
jgi:Putative beta-barrel porin-2, OmpL-like. bbp2/Carboxypeptidase regulatory-like domain